MKIGGGSAGGLKGNGGRSWGGHNKYILNTSMKLSKNK